MDNPLELLTATSKRVRIHDAQIVVKLPQVIKDLVESAADTNNVTASSVVRWALADYFERRGFSAPE